MSNETVLRSSGVTTTILGVLNQFQSFVNLSYNAMPRTTLNAKYSVSSINGVDLTAAAYTPTLKYFGVGTKGFQNMNLQQSAIPFPGDARCMDLYAPIPFRCVPVDSDLTTVERKKYRMRVTKTIGGVTYALYYLKMIDFSGTIDIVRKDASGDEHAFSLNEAWLTPNVPDMNQIGGNINTNTNRVIVRATGECVVTHEEIMEAVSVLYNNDLDYARISEIGYYTGYDVGFNPANANEYEYEPTMLADTWYAEAAYVQLAKHHCFRGSELYTAGSYIKPKVSLESECCILTSTEA